MKLHKHKNVSLSVMIWTYCDVIVLIDKHNVFVVFSRRKTTIELTEKKTARTIILLKKVFATPASSIICWKKDSRISNKSQRVCAIIAMFSQQGVKGNWSAAWKWTTIHNRAVGTMGARGGGNCLTSLFVEIEFYVDIC